MWQNGGTGVSSLTAGNVLVGDGTNDVQTTKVAPSGDFVGTTDTQSLTNKTITDSSNTIVANQLRTTTGTVVVDTSIAPTIGQALVATSATEAAWQTVPDQGEDNTASNVGTGGVGLFDSKVGVDLQFKNINSGSNRISVSNDVANKEVDIDVNEGNLDINNIGGSPLDVANGGTGVASLTAGNVLVGDGTNNVQTTKAAPSGDFVGTTDTQSLTNKTITDSSNTIVANQLRTTTGTVIVDTAVAPAIGQALIATNATEAAWQTIPANGENNTASNVGTGGVGLFDAKVGVDLQFKNINSGSNKVSITNDAANKEVDIDVNEGNLDINNIGGSPLDVANGGTGVASLTAGNVLVGDGTNDVQTTKAAPSGDFVGTTDIQSLTNKTITDSSNTIVGNQLRTTTGTVIVDTSAAPAVGQALIATSATEAEWQTIPDDGEDNTASNVGVGGIGLFDAKSWR